VGRYTLRPEADRDLDEQAIWYAERENADVALRFLDSVRQTLLLLALQPRMGRARKFRNPELAEVRWHPVIDFSKHLVFYRPTQDGIEALRILHGYRDLLTLLGESRP
jgi:toxin ParE1/3/4